MIDRIEGDAARLTDWSDLRINVPERWIDLPKLQNSSSKTDFGSRYAATGAGMALLSPSRSSAVQIECTMFKVFAEPEFRRAIHLCCCQRRLQALRSGIPVATTIHVNKRITGMVPQGREAIARAAPDDQCSMQCKGFSGSHSYFPNLEIPAFIGFSHKT